VDAEYLARFGDGELTPCAAPPPAALPDVASLFVGVGDVALPVDAATVASPPARARVALPVLGRPAPARGEVPASGPKQTGEALRAILPGLFADGSKPDPTGGVS
jgi:hypothetical protein